MKIATFNINGISSRLPSLLEWLEREAPDVVCLQELKAVDARFPAQALEQLGYGAIWAGQQSWNGVAILQRGGTPIEVRRGLPGNESDTQSRYLEAAIDGMLIACLYLPNGNPIRSDKFKYKLAWFERLIRHASALVELDAPVALVGDFNVVPTDFDIYNPKSWRRDALLQPESRAAFERLLDQGWTDALRHLHPEQRIYTFWDYFRNHWERDAGLRIDHLLLNAPLRKRLRRAGVDRWVRGLPKASDHAPTWIEIAGAAKPRKSAVKKKTARKSSRRRA